MSYRPEHREAPCLRTCGSPASAGTREYTQRPGIRAARYMGFGDKELVDQAAVDAMRHTLDGIVVIGEGEKDEAPMLYIGEHLAIA